MDISSASSEKTRSGAGFVASARLIAILTMASRVLGLIRESIFGYYFGTSELLSAFRIAFMAPNLARRLFGEGALSSAMIPVLTTTLHDHGIESARRLVGAVLVYLILILAGGVLVIEGVLLLAGRFYSDPAIRLTALLMPYMIAICTVAVISAVLQVENRFAPPALAPIALNLAIAGPIVLCAEWLGWQSQALMNAAAIGVLAGGVVQLVVVGWPLARGSLAPLFGGRWRQSQLGRIFRLMGPMILGLSAVQINSLADYLIAYVFVISDGDRIGPAVLGYAQYIYQLPLGVFGIAIATAIFPVLSARAAAGDESGVAGVFERGVRMSLFVALPATVGLIVVAKPLVATLYERNAFGASDTIRVSATLVMYSLGLVAYFAQHVLVRTFYSLHESRFPARVAAWMVLINFSMNLVLVQFLQERGLALATAITSTIQAIILARVLRKRLPDVSLRRVWRGASKAVLGSAVMAAVLVPLAGLSQVRGIAVGWQLAILVTAGVATYVATTWALRAEELSAMLKRERVSDEP